MLEISRIFPLCLLLVAGLAPAQVPDPTRPPLSSGAPGSPDAGGAGTAGGEGVHTVILRRNGKSGAVVGGQYVEVGGKLGDKRVIGITETQVVLQGGGGREVIKLTPTIEKTPATRPAEKRRTKESARRAQKAER